MNRINAKYDDGRLESDVMRQEARPDPSGAQIKARLLVSVLGHKRLKMVSGVSVYMTINGIDLFFLR
jgi:hypothetical protein